MSNTLSLAVIDGEPRIDSRIVANELGVTHRNTYELVDNYSVEFQELGILRFQTGEIKGRGQPEKFYLLNEDQTYFLMTLVRNTAEAVQLKKRLVKAFAQYRVAPKVAESITISKDDYIALLKAQIQYLTALSQPKRRSLSPEEKRRIKKFQAEGLSQARIGQQIGRAEGTVGTYLRQVRLGLDR